MGNGFYNLIISFDYKNESNYTRIIEDVFIQ